MISGYTMPIRPLSALLFSFYVKPQEEPASLSFPSTVVSR